MCHFNWWNKSAIVKVHLYSEIIQGISYHLVIEIKKQFTCISICKDIRLRAHFKEIITNQHRILSNNQYIFLFKNFYLLYFIVKLLYIRKMSCICVIGEKIGRITKNYPSAQIVNMRHVIRIIGSKRSTIVVCQFIIDKCAWWLCFSIKPNFSIFW